MFKLKVEITHKPIGSHNKPIDSHWFKMFYLSCIVFNCVYSFFIKSWNSIKTLVLYEQVVVLPNIFSRRLTLCACKKTIEISSICWNILQIDNIISFCKLGSHSKLIFCFVVSFCFRCEFFLFVVSFLFCREILLSLSVFYFVGSFCFCCEFFILL